MKLKKLLIMSAAGIAAYYLIKNKSSRQQPKQPGMISKLVTEVNENIKKPLDEVADDIPESINR